MYDPAESAAEISRSPPGPRGRPHGRTRSPRGPRSRSGGRRRPARSLRRSGSRSPASIGQPSGEAGEVGVRPSTDASGSRVRNRARPGGCSSAPPAPTSPRGSGSPGGSGPARRMSRPVFEGPEAASSRWCEWSRAVPPPHGWTPSNVAMKPTSRGRGSGSRNGKIALAATRAGTGPLLASRPHVLATDPDPRIQVLRGQDGPQEFIPGVSVIVGPNGSGSPTSSTRLAALGEQALARSGGGQMADVIFCGDAQPTGARDGRGQARDRQRGRPDPGPPCRRSRSAARSSAPGRASIGSTAPVRLLDVQSRRYVGIGDRSGAAHGQAGRASSRKPLSRPEERRKYIERPASPSIAAARNGPSASSRVWTRICCGSRDVMAELKRQLKLCCGSRPRWPRSTRP